MGLTVQTNVQSMFAQNQMEKTSQSLSKTFQRLSSGFRINDASDDAAGLGISKSMNAQVRSYAVAERNANDAVSMLQTADGGADQIHELLTRMRDLAVQASNGSLATNDYTNLDAEFQASLSEIDRVASSTQFNGINLLAGAAAARQFQVGIGTATTDRISVSFGGAGATQLAVNGTSVTTFTNAQTAITALDAGIQSLSGVRGGFGAAMNRVNVAVSSLQSMQTNMSASLSRIRDTDVAKEAANLSRNQVLSQAGASVLAQANQSSQVALSLLRG
ncbi:MAG: flagellin FliC [Myxococcales bacterium]|jgi:flagellin|nr:flagellin FliC [Myxococcales bacterium]